MPTLERDAKARGRGSLATLNGSDVSATKAWARCEILLR